MSVIQTTQRVRKYLKTLSYIGETQLWLYYTLNSIDDTHIYVGGTTTQTVRKYLKSNLSYIGESMIIGRWYIQVNSNR